MLSRRTSSKRKRDAAFFSTSAAAEMVRHSVTETESTARERHDLANDWTCEMPSYMREMPSTTRATSSMPRMMPVTMCGRALMPSERVKFM